MALGTPESRFDLVRRTIEDVNGSLRQGPPLLIESYRFGDRLAALPDAKMPLATDSETHLASALEQLPARFIDGLPIGVVVFSDGRTTEVEDLETTARGYARLGVPVHVVPVGDPADGRRRGGGRRRRPARSAGRLSRSGLGGGAQPGVFRTPCGDSDPRS